jgi:hypothetical protein
MGGRGIGGLASTSQGHPRTIFRRALEHRPSLAGAGRRAERPGRFPRPGPERSYECLFAVASRSFGPVLNEQHRRFVGVAVSLAS